MPLERRPPRLATEKCAWLRMPCAGMSTRRWTRRPRAASPAMGEPVKPSPSCRICAARTDCSQSAPEAREFKPGTTRVVAMTRRRTSAKLSEPFRLVAAVTKKRSRIMCQRVTCKCCGKPTYAGCGRHIEEVLGSVPPEARCHCRETTKHAPASQKAQGWLATLLCRASGRRT